MFPQFGLGHVSGVLLNFSSSVGIRQKGRVQKGLDQQLTYGVISEGVFAESLRKFCGNSAESSRTIRFIAPGKGAEILRKVCGNFTEICGKFSAMTPSPFPNDPISVVLT